MHFFLEDAWDDDVQVVSERICALIIGTWACSNSTVLPFCPAHDTPSKRLAEAIRVRDEAWTHTVEAQARLVVPNWSISSPAAPEARPAPPLIRCHYWIYTPWRCHQRTASLYCVVHNTYTKRARARRGDLAREATTRAVQGLVARVEFDGCPQTDPRPRGVALPAFVPFSLMEEDEIVPPVDRVRTRGEILLKDHDDTDYA